MPPKVKITKQKIVAAGLELARQAGPSAINARSIARLLGCSTQPVFSNYTTMEDLQQEVMAAANGLYQAHLAAAQKDGRYPPYKATGLGYISFARQEPELFRWLFMRDRTGETVPDGRAENREVIALIARNTGLSEDEAWLFHLEMWLFVHGLASTLATGYVDWDEQMLSNMLTDVFLGLKARFASKKEAG